MNNELEYQELIINQSKEQRFVCHKTKCEWTGIVLILVFTTTTCGILFVSGYKRHNKHEILTNNQGRMFYINSSAPISRSFRLSNQGYRTIWVEGLIM